MARAGRRNCSTATGPRCCGPEAPVCYLQDLYVAEEARGLGAGRALITAVADAARDANACRLYWLTHEGNSTARALYDRVGSCKGFVRYDYDLGT